MCKYASTFVLRYASQPVVIAVIWQVTFPSNLTGHANFREQFSEKLDQRNEK